MSDHSIYAPSSAKRWLKCNKSLLSNLVEQSANDNATLGTKIHSELEDFLKSMSDDPFEAQLEASNLSRRAKLIASELNDLIDFDVYRGEAEKQVFFYDSDKSAFGTCDYVASIKDKNKIFIVDFKTGMLAVDVEGNEQLLCYASGVPTINDETTYVLCIIQFAEFDKEPTVTVAEYSAEYVQNFKNRIANQINKVKNGDIEEVSGEHCLYCRIKQNCNSYTKYIAGERKFIESEQFNSSSLYARVKYAKSIKSHVDVIIAEAKKALDAGKEIPGLKYKTQPYGITWDEYAESSLFELYGNKIYKQQLKTAAELKKELGDEFDYVPEELYKVGERKILKVE